MKLQNYYLLAVLFMGSPLYGVENLSLQTKKTIHDECENELENRIQQGLKGKDLIKPLDTKDLIGRNPILVSLLALFELPEAFVLYGNLDLLQQLIEYDPSIKTSDAFHRALCITVNKKNLELTKWFITNGADLTFPKGAELLINAVAHNTTSYDKLFFDYIAKHRDFDAKAEADLRRTLADESLPMVKLLLMHKANGGDLNFDKGKLLRTAVEYNSTSMVKWLLKHNANPNLYSIKYGSEEESRLPCLFTVVANKNPDEQALCTMAKLLIVGGVDIRLQQALFHDEVTYMNKMQLLDFMKQTVQRRHDLFAAVARGENVALTPTNDEQRANWISRRHVRDIRGNNLLFYAIVYHNFVVARKLVKLWPELSVQPNFEGEKVLNLVLM